MAFSPGKTLLPGENGDIWGKVEFLGNLLFYARKFEFLQERIESRVRELTTDKSPLNVKFFKFWFDLFDSNWFWLRYHNSELTSQARHRDWRGELQLQKKDSDVVEFEFRPSPGSDNNYNQDQNGDNCVLCKLALVYNRNRLRQIPILIKLMLSPYPLIKLKYKQKLKSFIQEH